jgi:branched-chain amino acid transport system permease protein
MVYLPDVVKNGFGRYAALIVMLAVPLLTQNRILLTILIMCFFYSYLALAWNLIGGYGGQFSLAHGVFFGLGAYITGSLFTKFGVSPWIGMILSAFVSGIVAYGLGRVTFSFGLKGFFFLLVTLAITRIFGEVAKNIEVIGGAGGLWLPAKIGWMFFQFRSRVEYYYIILGFLLVGIAVSFLIEKSKLGHYLIAIREDEEAAEACGVDTKNCKTWAFVMSAFLTAIGGAYYIQLFFFVDPDSAFSLHLNINILLMVMVGGAGTIAGPIAGAFFFVLVSESLRFLPVESQLLAAMTRIIFALVLICVAIYFRRGIISFKYWEKWLRI